MTKTFLSGVCSAGDVLILKTSLLFIWKSDSARYFIFYLATWRGNQTWFVICIQLIGHQCAAATRWLVYVTNHGRLWAGQWPRRLEEEGGCLWRPRAIRVSGVTRQNRKRSKNQGLGTRTGFKGTDSLIFLSTTVIWFPRHIDLILSYYRNFSTRWGTQLWMPLLAALLKRASFS